MVNAVSFPSVAQVVSNSHSEPVGFFNNNGYVAAHRKVVLELRSAQEKNAILEKLVSAMKNAAYIALTDQSENQGFASYKKGLISIMQLPYVVENKYVCKPNVTDDPLNTFALTDPDHLCKNPKSVFGKNPLECLASNQPTNNPPADHRLFKPLGFKPATV